jgi:hypothetical protein
MRYWEMGNENGKWEIGNGKWEMENGKLGNGKREIGK